MTRVHHPRSLEEATALVAQLDEAIVYGGGTAIQILLKQGLISAPDYVDLLHVPGLSELTHVGERVRIGAMVRLREVERDPHVRRALPLAAETYGHVANPRVRNTASAGGNIAHGDYRLDPPAALMALDAVVEIASTHGVREVSIREFFTDFQQTAVQHDELVTAILVPRPAVGTVGAFTKMRSLSQNDWPCASAAVLMVPEDDFVDVRIGLGAVAPTTVYVAFDLTSDMNARQAVDVAIEIADSVMEPLPDVRGSANYKARMGRVAVEESIRRCLEELDRD
ncbi:FAD binding domain-containing protein [Nocardia bovistercoris]|uniref:FAD binding domain-containing protein n=1 Tax=Nocardia bovistercoris TaxID=2785916 RepID=A0A931IAL7_9NOCA|nr:FAD binding domain-containing protein [Nocardia bovistercoris]